MRALVREREVGAAGAATARRWRSTEPDAGTSARVTDVVLALATGAHAAVLAAAAASSSQAPQPPLRHCERGCFRCAACWRLALSPYRRPSTWRVFQTFLGTLGYYDEATGETQWEAPEGVLPPLPGEPIETANYHLAVATWPRCGECAVRLEFPAGAVECRSCQGAVCGIRWFRSHGTHCEVPSDSQWKCEAPGCCAAARAQCAGPCEYVLCDEHLQGACWCGRMPLCLVCFEDHECPLGQPARVAFPRRQPQWRCVQCWWALDARHSMQCPGCRGMIHVRCAAAHARWHQGEESATGSRAPRPSCMALV